MLAYTRATRFYAEIIAKFICRRGEVGCLVARCLFTWPSYYYFPFLFSSSLTSTLFTQTVPHHETKRFSKKRAKEKASRKCTRKITKTTRLVAQKECHFVTDSEKQQLRYFPFPQHRHATVNSTRLHYCKLNDREMKVMVVGCFSLCWIWWTHDMKIVVMIMITRKKTDRKDYYW